MRFDPGKYIKIIKDRIAPYFKKIAEKITGLKSRVKLSRKFIIIFIPVFAGTLIIAAGAYYYFFLYKAPNFDDETSNNIVTTATEEVSPGDLLPYEINYMNTGNSEVEELQVLVTIPHNTELHSFTEGGTFNGEKNTLVYSFENVSIGSSGKIDLELEVTEPLDNGTRISSPGVKFEYVTEDNSLEKVIDGGEGHIVKSSPVFTLSLSSVDSNGGVLSIGDKIRYTVRLKNTGNMTAKNVEVESLISSFLEDIESSKGNFSNGELYWLLEEMVPGKSKSLHFSGKVAGNVLSDMQEIINSVSILYAGELQVKKEVTDMVRLFPDFSESAVTLADVNGGGYLWAGETVSVRVTIKNTGFIKSDEYHLYCPIPAPATYISQSGTAEGIHWSDDIRGLIWDLNGLEVGETRDIGFSMVVNNDYYYKSASVTTEFYIISEDKEFTLENSSIYIQGHPYLNVVAMGDSLIVKSDWVQRLDAKLETAYPAADYNTIPSGVSGELSFQGLARYNSNIGPLYPTILIVAYGTNDVGASLSYFRYSLENIIAKGRAQGATVFVNLIGPITEPGKHDWPKYNNAIIQVAGAYGVPVINVTAPLSQNIGKYISDGIHYTPSGAELVAQTVFNSITQYLDELGGRK